MVEKTGAIILHQVKFTDTGIIVQVYTRKFGRLSILIKGMRNKKAGKHNVHFQPLSILDMVIYFRQSRGLQVLKEFSVSYSPSDIQSNMKKSCIAIFLGEVLTSVLKEESPHEELFNYINDSIIFFDECRNGFINFHIAFLAGLSPFLGFEPGKRENPEYAFFDMINGKFVQLPPVHGNYAAADISGILAKFFVTSWDTMDNILLPGSKRNEVLETLLRYYSLHLPGLKKINSLEILKEVFS
ncbi:MAG: DNA repair protein RecO [Odoribacter sp.]|nr:DNA repair protein RecO [Odoribacter sp.]